MLNQLLRRIGLSDKDAEVYLACLELGTQPASVIAKKAGLKRPTTYLILEGLLRKGMVSEHTGSNVKYFTVVQPDYLLNVVEKQKRELSAFQRELEDYLPQFQALTNNPYSLNPQVRLYDGLEGVERIMEDTLTSKTPLCNFANIDSWVTRSELWKYLIDYGKRRVDEKKIPSRVILTDTPMSRKYMEIDYPRDEAMTQVKWCPKGIPIFTNEINIYDNKVAICALGRTEFMGVIIESSEVANTQRGIFDLAWLAAVKGKPMG